MRVHTVWRTDHLCIRLATDAMDAWLVFIQTVYPVTRMTAVAFGKPMMCRSAKIYNISVTAVL